jgi:hypothetical protein
VRAASRRASVTGAAAVRRGRAFERPRRRRRDGRAWAIARGAALIGVQRGRPGRRHGGGDQAGDALQVRRGAEARGRHVGSSIAAGAG